MKKKDTEEMKKMKEKMENERKQRKRMPVEIKNERDKNVIRNLLFAIAVIIYFILLNLGYYAIEKTVYVRDTVVFSMASLIITIILFERAFKTDKGYFAIHGMETLVISIFTYFVPYTYFNFGENITKAIMVSPVIFGIYYCMKGIGICIKARMKKKNYIEEIVKKEEIKNDDTWIKIDKDEEAEKAQTIIEEPIIQVKPKTVTTKKKTTRAIKTTKATKTKAAEENTDKEEKPKATRTRAKKTTIEEKTETAPIKSTRIRTASSSTKKTATKKVQSKTTAKKTRTTKTTKSGTTQKKTVKKQEKE